VSQVSRASDIISSPCVCKSAVLMDPVISRVVRDGLVQQALISLPLPRQKGRRGSFVISQLGNA